MYVPRIAGAGFLRLYIAWNYMTSGITTQTNIVTGANHCYWSLTAYGRWDWHREPGNDAIVCCVMHRGGILYSKSSSDETLVHRFFEFIMRFIRALFSFVLATSQLHHAVGRALSGKPTDFIIADKRAPLQDIVST
jgi:hypothetical protein